MILVAGDARPHLQLCCHPHMTCAYRCRSLCPCTHSAHGAMATVAPRVCRSYCCPARPLLVVVFGCMLWAPEWGPLWVCWGVLHDSPAHRE